MYESTFLDASKLRNISLVNREIVEINILEQISNSFTCKDNNYLDYFNKQSQLLTEDELLEFKEQTEILYTNIKKVLEDRVHITFGFESRILDEERKEFIEDVYTHFILRFRKNAVAMLSKFILEHKDLCISFLEVTKKKEFNLIDIEELSETGIEFKSILNNIHIVLEGVLNSLNLTFDTLETSLFDSESLKKEDYSVCKAYYEKDGIYLNIEDGFMLNFKESLLNEDVLTDLAFDVRNRLFILLKK